MDVHLKGSGMRIQRPWGSAFRGSRDAHPLERGKKRGTFAAVGGLKEKRKYGIIFDCFDDDEKG